MAIKVYKPTTSARRHTSVLVNKELQKVKPMKNLRFTRKKTGGRNNQGIITVRHHGGGVRQFVRVVDFKRDKFEIPAKVESLQYDPIRSANIAQVLYADGTRRYILAAEGLKEGNQVITSKVKFVPQVGNRFPLSLIPTGSNVHDIELEMGRGGKIVRSAGSLAILLVIEGEHAHLKLPSGEIRKVPKDCLASFGQVSNVDYRNIRWGKAGRMRNRGIKPTVRGKVMNPVDHPHGGGEAKNSIGLKYPKTLWGKHALGVKTRNNKKASTRLILQRRKKK